MPNLLKPSMREKNRYIAYEILSGEKFSRDEIVKACWNAVLRFLGESGAAKTSLWMMDWEEERQRGIIKTNHRSVEDVRAALALMKEAKKGENRIPCVYRTIKVSGTLKKLKA